MVQNLLNPEKEKTRRRRRASMLFPILHYYYVIIMLHATYFLKFIRCFRHKVIYFGLLARKTEGTVNGLTIFVCGDEACICLGKQIRYHSFKIQNDLERMIFHGG